MLERAKNTPINLLIESAKQKTNTTNLLRWIMFGIGLLFLCKATRVVTPLLSPSLNLFISISIPFFCID